MLEAVRIEAASVDVCQPPDAPLEESSSGINRLRLVVVRYLLTLMDEPAKLGGALGMESCLGSGDSFEVEFLFEFWVALVDGIKRASTGLTWLKFWRD